MKKIFLKHYPVFAGLLVFVIYLSTMSRSIQEFDSGELATVQITWGVAHPTGYPIFTLVGYLFSHIPIPILSLTKLNLLCVIWNTLTVILLVKIISHLLNNISLFTAKKENVNSFEVYNKQANIIFVSIWGALTFAFSITYWIQATRIEVYSLQIFISIWVLYYCIKSFTESDASKHSKRYYLFISVLLGLGFSNHLMTIYLLPSIVLLFFYKEGFNKKTIFFLLLFSAVTFIVAFLFYLILMFRAQNNPVYVFGNPTNISGLINHVRAKDYSHFMFQGFEIVQKQFLQFVKVLSFNPERPEFKSGEFSLSIIFIITGFIVSFIYLKRIFVFLMLIIITSMFFAFNYSIPDINEYFLLIFLCFSIFASIAVYILIALTKSLSLSRGIFAIISIFLLFQVFANYSEINRSKFFFTSDYASSIISSLPRNAMIVSDNWDYLLSPSLYLQNVEKFREDIKIFGLRLLSYDWYKRQEKSKYSNLSEFLNREYYITWDIIRDLMIKNKFSLNSNQSFIPDVLTFKVIMDKEYHPASDPNFNIRFRNKRDVNENYYYELIAWILESRIKYEMSFNRIDRALVYYKKIKKDFSDYKISSEVENILASFSDRL